MGSQTSQLLSGTRAQAALAIPQLTLQDFLDGVCKGTTTLPPHFELLEASGVAGHLKISAGAAYRHLQSGKYFSEQDPHYRTTTTAVDVYRWLEGFYAANGYRKISLEERKKYAPLSRLMLQTDPPRLAQLVRAMVQIGLIAPVAEGTL